MKNIIFLLFLFSCFYVNTSTAQREIEYINPPSVQHQDYTINIDNAVSKEDYCKFRLVINNNTNKYQAFDFSKIGFIYENVGTYYPKKGKIKIIPPNGKISQTIRIDGNMDYRVEQFKVSLEGLLYASNGTPVGTPSQSLQVGRRIKSKKFAVTVDKVSSKKGRLYYSIDVTCNTNKNSFMTIDPTELRVIDPNLESLIATPNNKKTLILYNNKKFKLNGYFQSNSNGVHMLSWDGVITNYFLVQQPNITIPIYHTIPTSAPVIAKTTEQAEKAEKTRKTTKTTKTITTTEITSNDVQNTTPRPAAKNNCSRYNAPMNGYPVKVAIYSEEGECFQVKAMGEYINPNYAQKVSFGFPVVGKVMIVMENGESFNKSILLNDDIYSVTYKIKRNRKGDYTAKMILGTVGHTGPTAKELADQSAADLKKFQLEQEQKSNEQFAEHERKMAELEAKTKAMAEGNTPASNQTTTITTESSRTTTTSSNNNSSTNNSNNTKTPNRMHLRFMEGSSPLRNMRVQVSTVSGWTGTGTTDSNGDVYIDATNLNTKNINIYAKNSTTEYKLGNVVRLDDNLFALIEPATLMLKKTSTLMNAAEDGDTDAILDNMGW